MCELTGSKRASVGLPLFAGRAAPLLAEEIGSVPWGSGNFSTSLALLK